MNVSPSPYCILGLDLSDRHFLGILDAMSNILLLGKNHKGLFFLASWTLAYWALLE